MTTGKKNYNIDDYISDSLQKKHENKPDRMIRMVLPNGDVVIGKNRYDAIKKLPEDKRLKSQKEQIKIFEDYHGITDYIKKAEEEFRETEKKLEAQELKKQQIISSINKKSVWEVFLKSYKKYYNVDFEQTPETIKNIAPIVTYFAKDKEFLKYGVKGSNGRFLSQPSLDKGLCIIGGFGNGKTSIMTTIQKMFIGLDGYSFGRFSSHEIVRMYEEASKNKNSEILENFWKKLSKSDLYIDDVKAEPDALSFGRKNLLNSLFQERYNKKLKTHISINYATGKNGDALEAILEFKSRYSNQVYDRIYEMYNIIEFKGKSFRK